MWKKSRGVKSYRRESNKRGGDDLHAYGGIQTVCWSGGIWPGNTSIILVSGRNWEKRILSLTNLTALLKALALPNCPTMRIPELSNTSVIQCCLLLVAALIGIHFVFLQDKGNPEAVDNAFRNIPFNAVLLSEETERDVAELNSQPGSDGFQLDSTPLFEVTLRIQEISGNANF